MALIPPTFNPIGGNFFGPLLVEINGNSENIIFYTSDGTNPISSPSRQIFNGYSFFFPILDTTVLSAVNYDQISGTYSSITTQSYNIISQNISIEPPGACFTAGTSVIVSLTGSGSLFYSLDQEACNPNPTWIPYMGPLTVDSTIHISAVSYQSGFFSCPVNASFLAVVPKQKTNLFISGCPNASVYGMNVTFVINIYTCSLNGITTPATGTILLFIDGCPTAEVDIENDCAFFTCSNLNIGNHEVIALYNGDCTHENSSASMIQVVLQGC